MSGCAHIYGYLHMTIQTEVLFETLKDLISDIPWCSCKNFSTQDRTVVVITHDKSAALISWKGQSLEDY